MEFLDYIKKRGCFSNCTNYTEDILIDKSTIAYIGFDCTAESLHIGSLVQIMILRSFMRFGYRCIVLFGDGTSMIGDPSGKDSTRSMLNKEKIEENKVGIRKILERFLPDAIFMSNSEWIMNLNYVDFIRDYGSKFSVNQMVNLESVKLRLERKQNMSFLEFNYSILQAYDFVELNKRTNGCCRLQIGGSDQWGNIISGIGLGKKFGIDLYGITTPLITNSNGSKMGKTEKGAVWLSEDLLDPYDYWQFFRNIDDRDVVKYMNLFTEIEHVEEYENLKGNDINIAKKRLAFEATKICHGEENANTSMKKAESIFENGDVDELPVIFHNEISIINALKELNFVSSGADAKRLIIGGGCMINDVITRDKGHMIISPAKISVGKKKIGLIKGKM